MGTLVGLKSKIRLFSRLKTADLVKHLASSVIVYFSALHGNYSDICSVLSELRTDSQLSTYLQHEYITFSVKLYLK